MPTPLHSELKNSAKSNPAAYLSVRFLNEIMISKTLDALNRMKGKEIPVGPGILSASLSHADFSAGDFSHPPVTSPRVVKKSTALGNQISLQLNSDIVINVDIFVKGDTSKTISHVAVTLTGLLIRGSYSKNVISFEGLDFKATPTIQRTTNADDILKAGAIDPVEADRVEGVVAYSAVINAITNALGQKKQILLSELFPAFDFGTVAELLPLEKGETLGIIPAEFTRVESVACKCAGAGNIAVSNSSNSVVVPTDVKEGQVLGGGIKIGGPVKEKLDPLTAWGRRYSGEGFAGLYLPKQAQEGLTVSVLPAIQVDASDPGVIGFDASGSVGFSKLGVSLDAAGGGILVDVNMKIEVEATCDLNIGCGVRLPIGHAIIKQAPGSQAHLQMGFYPALDDQGNLKLRATLKDVDMGSYVAIVVGIGTALKLIGVSSWIGFLIDVVLAAIISIKLPGLLRDEVRKYLGENEWVLLKLGDLLKGAYPNVHNFSARFDVDGNSLLASLGAGD